MEMGLPPPASLEAHPVKPRRKKRAPGNPLQVGISSYITSSGLSEHDAKADGLCVQDLPKRYTIYATLLLLQINFPIHSLHWRDVYTRLNTSQRFELFTNIAQSFARAGQPVTHIAINARIPNTDSDQDAGGPAEENVLRRPSNLQPLFGEFGPSRLLDAAALVPSQLDFDAAFWVSMQQNEGIHQVWAPRWTMFSRGNVTEKARILYGDGGDHHFPGLTQDQLGHAVDELDVADLYIGIGYFAFSYLARGVKRVWGWDLNPWSIEGLKRGCNANGWRCLVVNIDEQGELRGTSAADVAKQLSDLDDPVRCIAFCGDNKGAISVMASIRQMLRGSGSVPLLPKIRHVNLGLLPTSTRSWKTAMSLVDLASGGWVHVHENVDLHQITTRSHAIVDEMQGLLKECGLNDWRVDCQHVEEVKSYGPGVVHCVFDIFLQAAASQSQTTAAF